MRIATFMHTGRRRVGIVSGDGAMLRAALLENVPAGCELNAEEAFGPVAVIAPYRDFDAAIEEVNRSKFGLQAGIFTRDIHKAMRAWEVLEVGGVLIGDVPSATAILDRFLAHAEALWAKVAAL